MPGPTSRPPRSISASLAKLDTPFDGGVGYGSKYQHSDMNNTLTAIEAMRWSERVLPKDAGVEDPANKDLNWAAVRIFFRTARTCLEVNRTMGLRDPKDRGGFVYYPGHSMAGGGDERRHRQGRVAFLWEHQLRGPAELSSTPRWPRTTHA
jgi:hypothetical protein